MRTRDLVKQEKMFSIIDYWKSGVKSKLEICKENNLSLTKFKYWHKIYSGIGQVRKLEPIESSFTKLPSEFISNEKRVEIEYPNGVKVKADTHDIETLRTLIKLIY